MIAIVNTSTHATPTGLHEYEVRINKQVITTFSHYREDGLARCLLRASNAVTEHDQRERSELFKAILEKG